jgi:hypothetical protein
VHPYVRVESLTDLIGNDPIEALRKVGFGVELRFWEAKDHEPVLILEASLDGRVLFGFKDAWNLLDPRSFRRGDSEGLGWIDAPPMPPDVWISIDPLPTRSTCRSAAARRGNGAW